ncbi:MAG: glycerate kinase, partial [Elusimicrobiaceae bacterium]|nr:glycerate kinase [Elusimicrobiaceae bacterium]
GFMDFFAYGHPSFKRITVYAENAFGKTSRTSYLWSPAQKTAVLETARICGLGKATTLNPLGASSFGVGQVILHALKKGARKIYIGLGGVACNDGGAGIAQALGTQFLDARGREIARGAKPLLKLSMLDIAELKKKLRGVKIYAVSDVKNPLLGPRGSARVYGPQKGATPAQVRILEKALTVYARAVTKATGKDIARTPGTAAAGGLCAGLYGLCGAQIIFGADFLHKNLPLDKWAKWADSLITSEGKLDTQTLYGKAPLCALQAAAKHHKPVLFICGTYEEKALKKLPRGLNLRLICLTDFAKNKQDSMQHTATYIRRILAQLFL